MTSHRLIDMPAAVYHGNPGDVPLLSKSVAHLMLTKSPLHAHRNHPKLGGIERKATRAMDRGTIIHQMVFEPRAMVKDLRLIEHDSYRTKAAKAERDEAVAAGLMPVLAKDYDGLNAAATEIEKKLTAMGVDLSGQKEGVAFWTERADDGTEVKCKARLDHWLCPVIDDLKTCASAHPNDIDRAIRTFGYEMQAAVYLRALEATFPDLRGRVRFRLLFAELEPPYHVVPVELDDSLLALGRSKWRRSVNLWAQCLNTGNWPGYASEPHVAAARTWDIKQEIEVSPHAAELTRLLNDGEITV